MDDAHLSFYREVGMGRIAATTIELPGGFTIPKGTSVIVSSHARLDPNVYPEPNRFDGYRFLHLRQKSPEQERYCQLVSSAKDHMGFGFGKHTCPGRFFAAAEVKIALCHILLKYDIMLVDGIPPKPIQHGFNVGANSTAMLKVRRRKEEIPLLRETSLAA
jgi:cytochrome P450